MEDKIYISVIYLVICHGLLCPQVSRLYQFMCYPPDTDLTLIALFCLLMIGRMSRLYRVHYTLITNFLSK